MMTKTLALAGLSAIALSATAAWAEIEIRDAYARAASPMAMAGSPHAGSSCHPGMGDRAASEEPPGTGVLQGTGV